jgi:Uma2 family endonuclease
MAAESISRASPSVASCAGWSHESRLAIEEEIMSTSAAKTVNAKPWRRYRFTDDEFDRMIRAGILREGSHAFLWNGEIIQPMAEDQPHITLLYNLLMLLAVRLPTNEWTVNINQPVQIRPRYRPQPDLVALRGPRPDWTVRGRVPTPEGVALLIEISDATYTFDVGSKLNEYARAGITQYWIVNVKEPRVEVYTLPIPGESRYQASTTYGPDQLVPLALQVAGEGVDFNAVPVREILAGMIG